MSRIAVSRTFLHACRNLPAADRALCFDFVLACQDDSTRLTPVAGIVLPDTDVKIVNVGEDLRAVVHPDGEGLVLLYAGRADEVARWATSHAIERHPVTRDLQIVVSGEQLGEHLERDLTTRPAMVPAVGLFVEHPDDYLLSLGVPPAWLPALRLMRTDDQLLSAASAWPEAEEIWEKLIRLVTGEIVLPTAPADLPAVGTLDSRRFWVVSDIEELRGLLDKSLEDWLRFLHPSQKDIVERKYNGPVRVAGSAGTGKTVVALHRAARLARLGQKVLLTSFVTTLCKNLDRQVSQLCAPAARANITCETVHAVALRLARALEPEIKPALDNEILGWIREECDAIGSRYSPAFLLSEWRSVIEPQGLRTWPEYGAAERTGRGIALSPTDRRRIWGIMEGLLAKMKAEGRASFSHIGRVAREAIESKKAACEYDVVIVDEVQDLGPMELKLLAALTREHPGGLMLVGDPAQRIYSGGYTLKSLGIAVAGRSHLLKINYRTTEQIRACAERVVPDAAVEESTDTARTLSLLHGPRPVLKGFADSTSQYEWIAARVAELHKLGVSLGEMAIFTRSSSVWPGIEAVLGAASIAFSPLTQHDDPNANGGINLGTLHRARGLEFKVVFLCDISADKLPAPASSGTAASMLDPADATATYEQERRLLYVGMTRARDELLISWTGEASPFLDKLLPGKAPVTKAA